MLRPTSSEKHWLWKPKQWQLNRILLAKLFYLDIFDQLVGFFGKQLFLSLMANSEKLGRPFNCFSVHPHVEFVIMEAILEQPDTTFAEIAYNVFDQTGSESQDTFQIQCLNEIFVFFDESGFLSFYWTSITIMFGLFLLRLFWFKLTYYFCRTKDFLVLLSVQEPQSNIRRRTGDCV